MDDDVKQLEAELKRLQPTPPSPVLMARIERDLGHVEAPRRPAEIRWLWWVALPLAAAAAVIVALSPALHTRVEPAAKVNGGTAPIIEAVTANESASLKPVAAENLLVGASDEGLITLQDGTPARRERLQYVDTITWKNPRTNASLTWRVPREEVRVVPISFQ